MKPIFTLIKLTTITGRTTTTQNMNNKQQKKKIAREQNSFWQTRKIEQDLT